MMSFGDMRDQSQANSGTQAEPRLVINADRAGVVQAKPRTWRRKPRKKVTAMTAPHRCARHVGSRTNRGRKTARMTAASETRTRIIVALASTGPPGQSVDCSCHPFMSGNDSPQQKVVSTSMTVACSDSWRTWPSAFCTDDVAPFRSARALRPGAAFARGCRGGAGSRRCSSGSRRRWPPRYRRRSFR